jgi:putative ABC transport system permease protein
MNSFPSQVQSSYENALQVSSEESAAMMTSTDELIHVSTPLLVLSAVPLLILAFISSQMGLGLESPMVVGIIRAFIQLSILGAILRPIFFFGTHQWWLVLLYVLFMVTLASLESSARSQYYFPGMSTCVLAAFLLNVGLVSLFAFGIIIRPSPLWEPQYVIPIVGMLLGNCINAVALSTNALMTSFVEQSHEIELYLSFGASPEEASARLIREAVKVGAMPMLNGMAVIGLISIPGMMTGQVCA